MGEAFPHSRVPEVGADGVFFKPIVPSQILEIAREALSRSPQPMLKLKP
jgi:hypothetical protein